MQWIQTEILILASFNRVLLCTWHAFTPKPPICSLHLRCSIFNSKISELPGPLRCLLVCGLLVWLLLTMRREFKCSKTVLFSSFLSFVSAHWKELLSGMLRLFLGMKHGAWRAECSTYNLKLKCYCFAFLHFLFLYSSRVSLSLAKTNLLFSALSYWTVWKRTIPLSYDSFW